MSDFGTDDNGVYKRLGDGRVLRVQERWYNTILTLSSSQHDPGWSDGW
jgi:hypothetical protein